MTKLALSPQFKANVLNAEYKPNILTVKTIKSVIKTFVFVRIPSVKRMASSVKENTVKTQIVWNAEVTNNVGTKKDVMMKESVSAVHQNAEPRVSIV